MKGILMLHPKGCNLAFIATKINAIEVGVILAQKEKW